MKKNYKIVVLSNLKDDLNATLKSAVKLAQTVNGKIEVLNIQKPTEVVKQENQLSAVRSIYSERVATDKKMKRLIEPIAQEYGVTIDYSCVLGNIKNEIGNYINKKQPDMVILGRRKPKFLKFVGDGVTEHILKTYKGEIMIAADENTLEPNKDISLGALDNMEPWFNPEFTEHLLKQSQMPLKSFKLVKNTEELKDSYLPKAEKAVEYVFEHNDNTIDKLPNYLKKNNVNLLLINRTKKTNLIFSDINSIINKINVPLMVMGEKSLAKKNKL